MTISWRTPGAWAAGSTTASPALPASIAAGDRMILFVGAKPYNATIADITGWTRIGTQQTNGTTASGIDTGSVTWSVFYRDWQSGDAAPSVSVTSGNVCLAIVHGAIKTAAAWGTTTAYFGSDTSSDTNYSITASGSSGNITSGDGLIHGTVLAGNNRDFESTSLTATGATLGTVEASPAAIGATATGDDLAAMTARVLCTAGTSSADAVCGWALTGSQTGGSALVRLRESTAVTHATSGALTGQGSTIVGTATRFRAHATSGTISGPGSVVNGTAVYNAKHATTGVLTGQGSTIAGVAARFRAHATSGTIAGAGSVVNGTTAHIAKHGTSGILVGAGSSIVGVAARSSPATGLQLKYWNGATWQAKPLKYWNGATWTVKTIKYWNGSTWV